MRATVAVVCVAFLIASASAARATLKPTTPDKPIPTAVTLVETGRRVVGTVVKYDARTLVIKGPNEEREYKWEQITPPSRYVLRSKLIDTANPADWLDQAELAMQCDMPEQARSNVAMATRLDPASKLKGDAILRAQGPAKPAVAGTTPAPATGSSGTPAGNAPAGKNPAGGTATAATASAPPPATAGGPMTSPVSPTKPPLKTAKYQKSTPEEDAAAIEFARKGGAEFVAGKMKLKFGEMQTAHFIIFTDWDTREYDFLKTNCEAAYSAVSKQFDIPVKENIFIGKLPIYMFAKQADFMKFAATLDGFPANSRVLGYFTGEDGIGHMAMWKPDTARVKDIHEAEREWAYTLTHEFTHAFISRYRTDRRIPRWLNEGTAEVIAYGQFPRPEAHAYARMMAGKAFKFENLFNDRMMPGGEMYPVMQTMVEALIGESRKGFLAMFDDIKEGMDPEEAMKKHFKAGYKDWEPAWRRYAKNLEN